MLVVSSTDVNVGKVTRSIPEEIRLSYRRYLGVATTGRCSGTPHQPESTIGHLHRRSLALCHVYIFGAAGAVAGVVVGANTGLGAGEGAGDGPFGSSAGAGTVGARTFCSFF